MNKIQLFSEKATYASPSSKLIILQGSQCIMDDSNHNGTGLPDWCDGEGVDNEDGEWGW